MKKGIILYVTDGKEEIHEWMDLTTEKRHLRVDDICLATSETEMAYGWWRMLTRGVQQVSCMRASYDIRNNTLTPGGCPLRLCG